MSSDIHDSPTLPCGICKAPTVLTSLVPFKDGLVCRGCYGIAIGGEKCPPDAAGEEVENT